MRRCRGGRRDGRNGPVPQPHHQTDNILNKDKRMKIAITATGQELTSSVDPRFGRAKYFILVDTESGGAVAHDNAQNLNAAQGAGIQSGETVVRLGATVLITGNVGPKAFRILNAAGVKVYLSGPTTVAEALRQFKAGDLKDAPAATVEGHW
jgi:predicted Fe-Mo cluster-binding NifX family protein